MKRPPKTLDLSTSRMPGNFYVPPKSRNPAEIERRRLLEPGELVLEKQARGAAIAGRILSLLVDPASLKFAGELIAVSGLNSAWHTFAQTERTTAYGPRRKNLQHPWMDDWGTGEMLLESAKYTFGVAESNAKALTRAYAIQSPKIHEFRRDFARPVGNASLALAVAINIGTGPMSTSTHVNQEIAREHGLRLVESRQRIADMIGSAPTLAQLDDPDSDWSVYFRRHATGEAFSAYEEATATAA